METQFGFVILNGSQIFETSDQFDKTQFHVYYSGSRDICSAFCDESVTNLVLFHYLLSVYVF